MHSSGIDNKIIALSLNHFNIFLKRAHNLTDYSRCVEGLGLLIQRSRHFVPFLQTYMEWSDVNMHISWLVWCLGIGSQCVNCIGSSQDIFRLCHVELRMTEMKGTTDSAGLILGHRCDKKKQGKLMKCCANIARKR